MPLEGLTLPACSCALCFLADRAAALVLSQPSIMLTSAHHRLCSCGGECLRTDPEDSGQGGSSTGCGLQHFSQRWKVTRPSYLGEPLAKVPDQTAQAEAQF